MNQKIAYLGIPGSYTYIAAKKFFTKKDNFVDCESVVDCLKMVNTHRAEYCVIPLENSLSGSITDSLDFLLKSNLTITGEVILHINHCMLGKIGQKIKNVYSHPQAITQCRNYLNKMGLINLIFTSDSATAAKMVAGSGDKTIAAIGSALNTKLYNLEIIKKGIGDNPHNYTRFAVVSDKKKNKGNKITVIFSVAHKPGSLVAALNPYVRLGLNLTKIESRPVFGSPWEYIFFLDFEHDDKKEVLQSLLQQMKKEVRFLRVLGQYEKGEVYES